MDNEKIQEMQILEQRLQNILLQKQAFQMELSETEGALEEIEKSEDVFKIVGNIMLRSDKNSVKNELAEKKTMLDLRVKSLEKHEDSMNNQVEKLRSELVKSSKS